MTEQDALARARATMRGADQHRSAAPAEPIESLTSDLTEHTSAVLTAYRELTERSTSSTS